VSRRYRFEAAATTTATPDTVWPLVGETARWREWAWMTRAELVRPGTSDPEGVGALRRFGVGPGGSREKVVEWDPPRHLTYEAVAGLPVRLYRADVDLTDVAGGTEVRWRCQMEPVVPGTGPALAFVLRRMVSGFARRVCRYADRLPPST